MAITDLYATAEQYRAVITPDRDDAGDELIEADLVAISRHLDGRLGQFFSKDAADVTIVVDVVCNQGRGAYSTPSIHSGNTRPILPPLLSVTSVQSGSGTPIVEADLELWPVNAPLGPELNPYREIRSAYGSGRSFAPGRTTIVCQRGWPAIPPTITAVTIQIAALLRLETPRATRRIPELGEAIETSPSAQALIYRLMDQYKVWWFA